MKDAWTPDRVKKLRRAFGDTQEAFAHRLGVSFVSVNHWENGRAISPMGRMLLESLERAAPKKK